jgi:O-methyltransferase involved in polyketide biosynthesis
MRNERHTGETGYLGAVQSALWPPLEAMNGTWRTALIQQIGQTFFRQHPDSMGINLGGGLTQPGWWQGLQLTDDAARRPLLLVCEEVLMYLTPHQVKAVMREIGENAHEGTQLVCDFMTPLGISRASMKPGLHHAETPLLWGAKNGLELARMHPRLELLAQHTSAEVYGPMTCMAEMCMSPWTGGPLCGVAHLVITEP